MSYFQDLRYALRIMRKNPGFASVAVMALALGIGANTTVFTITNAILWKNLPFKDPHQIVYLGCRNLARGLEDLPVSYPDFEDWRAGARSFQGLEAFSTGTMNVSDESGVPERMNGNWVTGGAFRLIGQSALLGRDFLPGEDRRGAQPVAILGYGMWQTRYGGDRGVLGKTIRVNAVPATVVGIMPQGMQFPYNAELWMPLIPSAEQESREVRGFNVFGRLLPGVSMAQARTEMNGIGRRLEQAYPKTNEGVGTEVMSFNERYNGHWRMRLVLLILMAAVGFVLLIACVNVANLLLSRSACRAREISIRTAVGAGRRRIVRQLLIESILLCCAGGGIGLLLSVVGVRFFEMSLANVEGVPYWIDFSIDVKVVWYLGAICFATAILFGLAPALRASRVNLVDTLKDGGYATSGGPRSRRLTSSLVVTQLALTVVLLFGAGLMMRDFLKVQQMGVGINPGNMLTMRLGLPEDKYKSPDDRIAFHDRLAQRLRTVAGIQSTAITSHLPINYALRSRLEIEGQAVADKEKLPMVSYLVVSPGYFETMGVSLLRGRDFGANDGAAGAEAAIVNDLFAARFLRGEDPVGKRIRLGSKPDMPWLTVVGVSPHIWQSYDNRAETDSVVYVPYRQEAVWIASIVTRSPKPS
jgi:putative ABC transport system permease protein